MFRKHPTITISSTAVFFFFLTHLFNFGNVPDEGVIIHKIQELLQLVQVSDVVFANSLNNDT